MFNEIKAVNDNPNGIVILEQSGKGNISFLIKKGDVCYITQSWNKKNVFTKTRLSQSRPGSFVPALPNTYAYMVAEKGDKPQFWAMCQQAIANSQPKPVPVGDAKDITNVDYKKEVEKLLASNQFQSDLNELVSRKYGSFCVSEEGNYWLKLTTSPNAIFLESVQFGDNGLQYKKANILDKSWAKNSSYYFVMQELQKLTKWKAWTVPAIQGSDIAVANAVKLGKPAGLMTFLNASLQAAGKSPGSLTTLGALSDSTIEQLNAGKYKSDPKYGDPCMLSPELQAKVGECLTKLSSNKDGCFIESKGNTVGYIYIDKQAGNTGSFYIAMNNQIISGKFDCNGSTMPHYHSDGIFDYILEIFEEDFKVVPAEANTKQEIQKSLEAGDTYNQLYVQSKLQPMRRGLDEGQSDTIRTAKSIGVGLLLAGVAHALMSRDGKDSNKIAAGAAGVLGAAAYFHYGTMRHMIRNSNNQNIR